MSFQGLWADGKDEGEVCFMSLVVYSCCPVEGPSPRPWTGLLVPLAGFCFSFLPVVFPEVKGGGSKSSFQMHRKTWRGWPMAASRR